jgi:hypothetical protein
MKIQQKPLDSPSEVWALLCNAFGVKFKPWQDFQIPLIIRKNRKIYQEVTKTGTSENRGLSVFNPCSIRG